MIQTVFSSPWLAAVANHLWQSTLFAAVAALLTLTFRQNYASVRYWLWMAASVKFLIPFSWLFALGSRMSWSQAGAANAAAYLVIEEVSQPFTRSVLTPSPSASVAPSVSHLPSILAATWLCGFISVLLVWVVRWNQISKALRSGVQLHEGREVEALRRLERSFGLRTRVDLLLSRAMLEPGIFGMIRPVLVWPEGISERLENPHLEAVLAHELWHVRRRDNLAAVFHMLVEAVFWFHPLVWWLGARLIDERERACDEEVLESGSDRHVYAESILKVCEFCVGSPLACVSGVTGADLKKRMVHIMSEQVVRKLDFGKRLLLTAVAALAVAIPFIFGLAHATPSRAQSQSDAGMGVDQFESVSIKPSQVSNAAYPGGEKHMVRMMFGPDGYMALNVTMLSLIKEAYDVQANQVLGGPDWLDTAAYDVQASTKPAAGLKDPGLEDPQVRQARHAEVRHMLQATLADRLKLALHNETKDLPAYILTVADGGSKLQSTQAGRNVEGPVIASGVAMDRAKVDAEGHVMSQHQMFMESNGGQAVGITARGVSMEDIVRQISMQLGTRVVDKSGLHGNYDFNLHWSDDRGESENASAQSYVTAVQEQLGMKLQQVTAPTQVLVIDHIERPEEVSSASR